MFSIRRKERSYSLFDTTFLDFGDYAENYIKSKPYRFGAETFGYVTEGVIIIGHNGVLSGKGDGLDACFLERR